MESQKLERRLGITALTATGVCSMIGASIHVVPFMIQKNVPGIGPFVLPSFLLAALPAALAALALAALSSAMPKAGGSYLYVSRGLNPFAGFIASFSQWFGLSIAIGVISYILVAFLRDLFLSTGMTAVAESISTGIMRPVMALLILWTFIIINIRGAKAYTFTLVPMMYLMFALGSIVIIAGLIYSTADFEAGYKALNDSLYVPNSQLDISFSFRIFLTAGAVLFASFIGFDSIAQAGGEARNPQRNLPIAIGITVIIVTGFYLLFTGSVYHLIPWTFIAEQAQSTEVTAPGLLAYVLPVGWTIAILAGATISLINDLPGMILSVSRLLFAWAADRIFPPLLAHIHPVRHTPDYAIIASGMMASIGIIGSHLAGDFFLGIDIMVTAMLVNFTLVCVTLIFIHKINPEISAEIKILKSVKSRKIIGSAGAILLILFLIIQTQKDLAATGSWYFHSTWIYLIVMFIATLIFVFSTGGRKDNQQFKNLPNT